MSTKHTPEPWIAIGWQVETEREDYPDPCSCNFDLYGQWEMTHDKNELACANAERIAACVNACAGIPTDFLEQKSFGDAVTATLEQLKQQHDELLAALKSARDLLDGADGLSWNNLLNLAAEEVESIDKAIAKAGAQ